MRPAAGSSSAVTDEAGRYTITDLPKAREYALTPVPKPGEPFLFTSRKVEAADDERPLTADVEVVRGIPFRVRVLDRETGKPLKGYLSYFPIHPNNPFERGVMGSVACRQQRQLRLCGILRGRTRTTKGNFTERSSPGQGSSASAIRTSRVTSPVATVNRWCPSRMVSRTSSCPRRAVPEPRNGPDQLGSAQYGQGSRWASTTP